MGSRRHSTIGRCLVLAASLGLVTSVAVRAQRGGGGGAAAKPLVPVAASSLVSHPDLYLGQTVSVTGVAEQTLTPTVFIFDQGKTQKAPGDVLVIAPTLTAAVPLQAYITVIGDAVKFDPAEVTKKFKNYTLDLAPDVIEKYRGKPALLATSVVDPTMKDIAKPVVPPPTPAEAAFDGVMKQVGPGFTAIQTAVNGSQGDQVRQQAIALSKLFSDTQAFFTTRNTADAIQWATDAGKRVHEIDEAAAAGKWDDAKAAAASLNQACGSCHAAHRDRQDDGTYRVKG
jgi:cytochrome c556